MKTPAFQFYASDFLVGIMGMTDEEVGIYMKMLAFQWVKGGLPNDPKAIKIAIGSRKNPSETVMKKFRLYDDGSMRNDRLELERQKQENFRASRAENASKRWGKECTSNARASGSMPGSTCKTDALQSSSSDSSRRTPKFEKPSVAEIEEYGLTLSPPFTEAAKFVDHYDSNGWKVGKNPMKDWKATVRKWNRSSATTPNGAKQGGTATLRSLWD